MNFELELDRLSSEAEVKKNEPMSVHTSWKVGGPADYFVIPERLEHVSVVTRLCNRYGLPLTVIGNGTNLLVREGGLRGVVAKIGPAFQYIAREGFAVRAGAGTSLPCLARTAASWGLAGLEPAGGIPGTAGGALVMNAGAFGAYIGDLVKEVTVVAIAGRAGQVKQLTRKECGFRYRGSDLPREGVIVEVLLQLGEGDPIFLENRLQKYMAERLRRHPRQPSAGSVFKNPAGSTAGKLIEAAGGKGLRVGRAQVSEQHANFIVNLGGATAGDILSLMVEVQRLVKEKFDLELHPEVRIIGEDV